MGNQVLNIKTPLFKNVAHLLRRRILDKHLQPGEHLNEVSISKELSISRGPIRDGIKMLEKEGLVETLGNGRTVVVGFTRQSFQDWTRTRISLERLAIEEFSRKKNTMMDRFSTLNDITRKMQLLTDQQKDLAASIELDLQFHCQLVAMSGNRTLMILWDSIYYTLMTIMELIAENYGNISKQTEMHMEIVEKLLQDDFAGALLCLTTHIEEGEKAMLSALQIE